MSDRSIGCQLFETFLIFCAVASIYATTNYLFDKTKEHDDKIEELFSRLEECEKSSQEHELKK